VAASHPLSLRLGADGWQALEDIARKRGITRSEAAREAIAETAERERRRAGLAAEVERLANDPVDRAEMRVIAEQMATLAPDWPE
jgi:predicted transcriptional regulator